MNPRPIIIKSVYLSLARVYKDINAAKSHVGRWVHIRQSYSFRYIGGGIGIIQVCLRCIHLNKNCLLTPTTSTHLFVESLFY